MEGGIFGLTICNCWLLNVSMQTLLLNPGLECTEAVFVGTTVVFQKQLGQDMLIIAAKYQNCNGANVMQ